MSAIPAGVRMGSSSAATTAGECVSSLLWIAATGKR